MAFVAHCSGTTARSLSMKSFSEFVMPPHDRPFMSRRQWSIGDRESADWFARHAGTLYLSVDDLQSSVAVMHRPTHFDKPTQDSVVLLGRQPSREESLTPVRQF
jgi:hypothetical protein